MPDQKHVTFHASPPQVRRLPASPSRDEDAPQGRAVVNGTVATTHYLNGLRAVEVASPFLAAVVGFATYAGTVGIRRDEVGNPHAYTDDATSLWKGAVGFVAGAVAPAVIAWISTKARTAYEHHFLRSRDLLQPETQLKRLVDLAAAHPLTDEGFHERLEKIETLRKAYNESLSAETVALQIARLGVIARTTAGCSDCCGRPLTQVGMAAYAIKKLCHDGEIDQQQCRAALVALATALPGSPALDADKAEQLAALLMHDFDFEFEPDAKRQAARADELPDAASTRWACQALMVELGDAACFAGHEEVLRTAGADHLKCEESAYRRDMPRGADRMDSKGGPAVADGATSPSTRAIEAFLEKDWTARQPDEHAAALDDLVVHMTSDPNRATTPGAIRKLTEHLKAISSSDARLGAAKARAYFFANRWLSGQTGVVDGGSPASADTKARHASVLREITASSMVDHSEQTWGNAPCRVLEPLHFLAYDQQGPIPDLQKMADEATTPEKLRAAIASAPLLHIQEEVGAALAIARRGTARGYGEGLLAIQAALQGRPDLPHGAFLEGLLSREQALELITEIEYDGDMTPPDKARYLAGIPRLCGLQATKGVLQNTLRTLETLRPVPSETIVQTVKSMAALHHSWVSDPEIQVYLNPARRAHFAGGSAQPADIAVDVLREIEFTTASSSTPSKPVQASDQPADAPA